MMKSPTTPLTIKYIGIRSLIGQPFTYELSTINCVNGTTLNTTMTEMISHNTHGKERIPRTNFKHFNERFLILSDLVTTSGLLIV